MRIAFQHAAVHERAGVAFVGVADDELLFAGASRVSFHFRQVGNPAPPRPRRPGAPQRLDDLLRIVGPQRLGQGLVAVPRDVVLDLQRVDHAAIAQDDFLLLAEEVDIASAGTSRPSDRLWVSRPTGRPLTRCSATMSLQSSGLTFS